jgi:AcrR family transcriptional regulator
MKTLSETRRARILEVAQAIFLSQGYALASMANIASAVSCSKATLYNYYASKDDLFVAVLHQFSAAAFDQVFEPLASVISLRKDLEAFGRRYLRALHRPEVVSAHRMAVAEATSSAVGQLLYVNGPEKGWGQIVNCILAWQEQGWVRLEIDVRRAAWHMKALLESESWLECLLGAPGADLLLSDDAIAAQAHFAVDVWLRAYQ